MRCVGVSGEQQLRFYTHGGFVRQTLDAFRRHHGRLRIVLDQRDSRVLIPAAHPFLVQNNEVRDVLAHKTPSEVGGKLQLFTVASSEHVGGLRGQNVETPTREDFGEGLAEVLVKIGPGQRHLAIPGWPSFQGCGQPLLVGALVLLDQSVHFLRMILRIGQRVKNLRQRQVRILGLDFFRRQAAAPVLGDDAHSDPRALNHRLSVTNPFHVRHVRMFRDRLHGNRWTAPSFSMVASMDVSMAVELRFQGNHSRTMGCWQAVRRGVKP